MSEKKAEVGMLDDAATIFSMEDRPVKIVDVPEWGCKVRVRGMSAGQRVLFSEGMPMKPAKEAGKPEEVDGVLFKPYLLTYTIVGANGNPIFKPQDYKKLMERNVAAIDRLYTVAESLCGMGAKNEDAARGN